MKHNPDIGGQIETELSASKRSPFLSQLLTTHIGSLRVWETVARSGTGADVLLVELSAQASLSEHQLVMLAWLIDEHARASDTNALNALQALRLMPGLGAHRQHANVVRVRLPGFISWCIARNALLAERALDLLCDDWQRLGLAWSFQDTLDAAKAYAKSVADTELREHWMDALDVVGLSELEPQGPDESDTSRLIAEILVHAPEHIERIPRIVAQTCGYDAVETSLQIIRVSSNDNAPLNLGAASRAWTLWSHLFSHHYAAQFSTSVEMVPIAAGTGSLVAGVFLDVRADDTSSTELSDTAMNQLVEALRSEDLTSDWAELLSLLRSHGLDLTVTQHSWSDRNHEEIARRTWRLSLDNSNSRRLWERAEASSKLLSPSEVPQADDIKRVFRLVDVTATTPAVTHDDLGIVQRQLHYYRQAARILGLIDENQRLTPAGRHLHRLSTAERVAFGAFAFSASKVGSAWIEWSRAQTLGQVHPNSAAQFLGEMARGLSDTTRTRRAKTLATWSAFFRQGNLPLE